jgi:hypothetical protein
MEGTMGDRVRSLYFEVVAFLFDPRGLKVGSKGPAPAANFSDD